MAHGRILRTLVALIGILLAATVYGCGGGESGPTTTGPSPAQSTDSTQPSSDWQAQITDGTYELRVDRNANDPMSASSSQLGLLSEDLFQPAEDGPILRIEISGGGARVEASGDYRIDDPFTVSGERVATTDGLLWYTLDFFAEGHLVIWETTEGLQAELTEYGSGVYSVYSGRGRLTKGAQD